MMPDYFTDYSSSCSLSSRERDELEELRPVCLPERPELLPEDVDERLCLPERLELLVPFIATSFSSECKRQHKDVSKLRLYF